MVIEQAKDAREPGELFGFIAESETIFPNTSIDPSAEKIRLVSSAAKFGVIFISNHEKINVYKTEQLIDQKVASPLVSFNCNGLITQLACNCDGLILMALITIEKTPFVYLYDVPALVQSAKDPCPFYTLPLSPNIGVHAASLAWNPCDPTCIAFALSSGDLCLMKIKESSVDFTNKNAIGASAVAWSAKGKQLAVGKKDGTMALFKPDLSLVREIEAPPIANVGTVLDITWFTNTEFFIGYLAPPNIPNLVYVNAVKGKPAIFVNFEDVCYSSESRVPVSYYSVFISEWNLLLVFSSNGVEMGVLGKSETEVPGSCNWCQWFPDDGARASMQFFNVVHETFPLGFAIDYTAQKVFQNKDETVKGPFPVVFTLSTKGILNFFFVENRLPGVSGVNQTPNAIPTSGGRTPEQYGRPSLPQISSATVSSQPPAASLKDSSSTSSSLPQKSEATLSSSFSFSTPVKSNFGFASSSTPKSVPQPSLFSSVSQANSSQTSSLSTFSFTPASTTSSSALFSAFSAPKPVSMSSQQPTVPLPAPSPQKSIPVAQVPVQASQIPPFSSTNTGSQISTPAIQPIAPNQRVSASVSQTPSVATSVGVYPIKPSKETLLRYIQKEDSLFEKEMNSLKAANDSLVYQVGSEKEDAEIKAGLENVNKFSKEIKKTTDEQNNEVDQLHQKMLEALTSYEETRSYTDYKQNARNQIYNEHRPLDLYSQRKLNNLRTKYQYIVSQISEANAKLESMWEGRSSKKKPLSLYREQKATTENLYRTVQNLQKKRLLCDKLLEDIIRQMKKLHISSTVDFSLVNAFGSNLLDMNSLVLNENQTYSSNTLPAAASPSKNQQLKEVLSQRKHTPVRDHSVSFILKKSEIESNESPERQKTELKTPSSVALQEIHKPTISIKSEIFSTPITKVVSQTPISPFVGQPLTAPQSASPLSALSSMVGSVFSPTSKGSVSTSSSQISGVIKTEFPPSFTSPMHTPIKIESSSMSQPQNVQSKASHQLWPSNTTPAPTASLNTSVSKIPSGFSFSTPSSQGSIFSAIKPPTDSSKAFGTTVSSSSLFSFPTSNEKSLTFSATSAFKSVSTQNVITTTTPVTFAKNSEDSLVSKSSEQAGGSPKQPQESKITSSSTVFNTPSSAFAIPNESSVPKSAISAPSTQPIPFSFGGQVGLNKSGLSLFGVNLSSTSVETKPFQMSAFTSASQPNQLAASETKTQTVIAPVSSSTISSTSSSHVISGGNGATKQSSIFDTSLTGTGFSVTSNTPSIFDQVSSANLKPPVVSAAIATISSGVPVNQILTSTSTTSVSTGVTVTSQQPQSTTTIEQQVAPTVSQPILSQSVSTTTGSVSGDKTTLFSHQTFASIGTQSATVQSPSYASSESKATFGIASSGPSLFGGDSMLTAVSNTTSTPASSNSGSSGSIFGVGTAFAKPESSQSGGTSTSSFFGGTSIFRSPAGPTSVFDQAPKTTAANNQGMIAVTTSVSSSGPISSVFNTSKGLSSVFGSSPSGSSIFGGQSFGSTAAAGGSIFGKASSSGGIFGGSVSTAQPATTASTASSSLFGSSFATGAAASSPFGTPSSSAPASNLFGPQSSSAPSASTPFGTQSSSAPSASTPFGTQSSSAPSASTPFGAQGSSAPASTPFGTQGASASASTPFGTQISSTVSASSPFGAPSSSTAASSIFGAQSATSGASPSPFGAQSSSSTAPSIFGSASATTGSASPFGAPGATGSIASSPFGAPGATTPSPFNTQSAAVASPFATTTASSSIFGTPNPNSTASPFGAQSTGASAFGGGGGGGFFSGLGKPSASEDASKNVFGSVKATPASSNQSSLFGGGNVASSPFAAPATTTSSMFSPVKSEGSSIFGGKSTFGSPGIAKPIFGGTPSFGSPPAFGATPAAFGGTPSFGGSAFGAAKPPTGPGGSAAAGFGSFSGGSSFGSISNQSGAGVTGFGQLSQQTTGSNASNSPFNTGGNSFSSWR